MMRPGVGLRLLVVSPDDAPRRQIARWAERDGGRVEHVHDPDRALRCISSAHWDYVLPVLSEAPEDDLGRWVERLAGLESPNAPRLVPLTRRPSVGLALRAAQLGVRNVLSMPVQRDDLLHALHRTSVAAGETPIALPNVTPVWVGPSGLVAESPAMLAVYNTIARVAPSSATVLVLGDSGTGKELAARAVHHLSERAAKPFIAVNCAAIPDSLLESELFGHEKGAFTEAMTQRTGRFERANGGTLFLDEIADMSMPLQSKILRAIQEQQIERVGDGEPIPVDVRLIAATHRDLAEAIAEGRFREDLYYRLAVVTLRLPPLGERGDDLLLLLSHFVSEFNQRHGKHVVNVSDRALGRLRRHEWVGNVRELRNVTERAVLVADGETLLARDLPEDWPDDGGAADGPMVNGLHGDDLRTLREMEAQHIARVLDHTGGQLGAASQILGIHRNTLTRKVREYGLS